MIQDIDPHHLFNQYNPAAHPEAGDTVLAFNGFRLLVGIGSDAAFLSVRDLPENAHACLTYLFRVDDESYYLWDQSEPETLPGFEWRELRSLHEGPELPLPRIFAAHTAKHLADWYRDTRFCGRCGCRTVHSETERARVCPSCGYTIYPRIMPAVIVGVINGDKLLLTRYREGPGFNALIAGFTEIGETLEETVSREVMEEAGVRVKNIRYYKSQPWGMANDILAGFFCDLDGNEKIRMDPGELRYAEWVRREKIVLQPDSFSLTNEMMQIFREGREPG